MIVVNKQTGMKFIVASIIKVPGEESLYKLENKDGITGLIRESAINSCFIKHSAEAGKAVDYFAELDLIKDKVVERINKINEVLRWTESRKSLLNKDTPEYQKIESDELKYKEDLKYYQKVLENVKDKIVDFQSLQSRVNLEREIDLQELYSSIGLSPEKLENQEVQIVTETPSEKSEETIEKTIEKTEEISQ